MHITRNGSRPPGRGSAEWLTGAVRIDPLFDAPERARVRGASVTFEPGAHEGHAHPLGQTLLVTAGCGLAQRAARNCRRGTSCFYYFHDTYHAGQTDLLRQLAGKNDALL